MMRFVLHVGERSPVSNFMGEFKMHARLALHHAACTPMSIVRALACHGA